MTDSVRDRWAAGDAYDAYMGRWSRFVADAFVAWLAVEPARHWLDVGCGTGVLTGSICARCEPASVVACDQSAPFVEYARTKLADTRVSCVSAAADCLPERSGGFDLLVSGLVLNFIRDPDAALIAMRDRVSRGGLVAAYIWDYAGGLEFLQHFWQAAVALDPGAAALDEAHRFGAWQSARLRTLFEHAGFVDIETTVLTVPTTFTNFQDFWSPFLGGTGPAPSYVAGLSQAQRQQLAQRLEACLPVASGANDASIPLHARALAVRGRVRS